MKTIIAGLILLSSATLAQQKPSGDGGKTFKFSVKGNAAETWLMIDNLAADLQIEGISGSEIRIESKNYAGIPEKAKGLKPLSATGPENTGIGLSMTQEGTVINLSGAHNEANDAAYTLYVPKNLKLKLNYNSWQAGDVVVKGMAGEIEAITQVGDIKFVDITGPIVAHTLSSDLEVVFTSLATTSPSSLSSTSGDIDITIPAGTKGDFKMATVSGGVYTAFDFDFGDDGKINRIGGQSAKGKLNGGGVEVQLKTVSGDIYIRKPE
ncbi:MAG: hypothetical protein Tsb0034_14490 [Ekhidna sp.]